MRSEILLMWAAVTFYAVGTILFAVGAVFRKERVLSVALWISLAGLIPHTLAVIIRWVAVGHGPYLGFYEVVSSYAWFSVVVLGLLSWWRPGLKVLGVIIMPVAFLMLGGAMLAPNSPLAVTPTLASWWLNIHVTFAKLSYTSFIAAFAVGVVYLIRDRKPGDGTGVLDKLPPQEVLDDLIYRVVGIGFIFLSIMIVAGAIWANEAWGRYWGWDPIETWSLISWIVYAVYLHLRLTMGWRGKRSAIYAVVALPVMLFTLIGVPLAYNSIHGAYLKGY